MQAALHALQGERARFARPFRASTLDAYALTVERVIQGMRAQVAEPLSLDEMAEIACLSPFHFSRVFRATTGVPPGEFLAALRLDAAKRLLLTTSLSVTDVCFELGYTSLGTFCQRFKRLTGLSPLRLRQLADDFDDAPLRRRAAVAEATRSLAIADMERAGRGDEAGRASEGAVGVVGVVSAPPGFAGPIFLGLFPRPIPQERPVACVTIAAPGHYRIAAPPDGRYYLLGAALPWSPDPLTYLAPDAGLLVGVAERPALVRGARASLAVHLTLRPRALTDPPLLGVFPPLQESPSATRAIAVS